MPVVQYLRLDLGAEFDVTAIIYLKKWTAWNSVGLTIRLFDESNTKIGSDKIVETNNTETTFDLRKSSLSNIQKSLIPITIGLTTVGGSDIALYDCNDILVGIRIANNTITYNSITYTHADFRTYRDGNLNQYAPIMPYNLKRGGYSLENAFRLTGQTGFSSVGVKARYIKIIPRNSTTPLYISQIIAVDEFGINRAFEKQTYQQLSSNPFPTNGKNAVDGVYEASFDTTEFFIAVFQKIQTEINAIIL